MTKVDNDSKQRHLAEISKIKEKWALAFREYEGGNFSGASRLLNEATAASHEIAKVLADEYPECLLSHKVKLASNGEKDETYSEKELKTIFSKVSKNIRVLRGEIQANYPGGLPLLSLFRSIPDKSTVLIMAGIAAVIGIGILGSRLAPQKKGLAGDYYVGTNFERLYKHRVDKKIDFDWGYSAPFPLMARDYYSVRWTGYLRVPEDGTYDLVVRSDDGCRLTVGNVVVIDDWKWQALTETRAKVNLKKGYYPLKLEYFDFRKTAAVYLSWKSVIDAVETIIPPENLVTSRQYLNPDLPIRTLEVPASAQ